MTDVPVKEPEPMAPSPPTRSNTRRGLVLASVMAAMFMAAIEAVGQLVDATARAQLPAQTLAVLRHGVAHSLQAVYVVVAGIAVLVLVSALLFPRRVEGTGSTDSAGK